MWRPDNWEKILLVEVKKIPDPKLLKGNLDEALLLFTEAGADAGIKALIKEIEKLYKGEAFRWSLEKLIQSREWRELKEGK
jgi:hypothetical protein